MFKPNNAKNEVLNKILSFLFSRPILKWPLYIWIAIGLMTALIATYELTPLWLFVLVLLLNILWNVSLPRFYCKNFVENKEFFKKLHLYYLVFVGFITLLSLMCVNNVLGYSPFYLIPLIALLMFLFAVFTPVFFNPNNKKELKNRLLSLLFCVIVFGLIATLFYVCVNGYPLWVVTSVLILNILHLVFGILFDPTKEDSEKSKKDRKRLLLWGFPIGILYVIFILLLIFSEIPLPPFAKTIALFIGFWLGCLLPQKF